MSESIHDRGQTTIDFLVGIGVFMVTFGFVVGFIPSVVAPFADNQEPPVVADRVVSTLTDDLLASQSSGVLNTSCTLAFFDDSLSSSECSFDNSNDLTDRVGITSRYRLNISLIHADTTGGTADPLCTDGATVQPCSDGGERLAVGPTLPRDSNAVTTAARTVRVDQTTAVLVVRVW